MFPFGDPFDSSDRNDDTVLTADTVIRVWDILVEGDAAWAMMPPDDRPGYVRVVVRELLNLAEGIDAVDRRRRLERIARRHGAFRRGQGCGESIVRRDFAVVRAAIREALRGSGAAPATVREATRCLLPDWQLARRAAHIGFFNA